MSLPTTRPAGSWWPGWQLRRLLPLALVTAGTAETPPPLGVAGWALLVLTMLGWLGMLYLPRPASGAPPRAVLAGPALMGAAGVALTVLHAPSAAVAFPAVACLSVAIRAPARRSLVFAAVLTGASAVGQALHGNDRLWLLAAPGVCLLGLMIGLIRRQNEALAEETRLTREEQARAAALDERARIAREIHDVLAHSLAALTVQLETADALLEGGRAEQARTSVARASQLAREGLAETRRAIGALRGETVALPELLSRLADGYRADVGGQATVRVDGRDRELNPDIGLTLYRTAQEAMTNVRKHAPGARVELMLRYSPSEVALSVADSGAPPAVRRPLADAGGGYGLTGLRERAELAGGAFAAGPDGPDGGGWRVSVRIPA